MMKHGIKQHDARDCGAACLSTICLYFGLKVPLVKMREALQVDKNGTSLYALTKTAPTFGLQAEALQGSWEDLLQDIEKGNVEYPFIANVIVDDNFFHYVVVNNVKNNIVQIFDPSKGKKKIKISEFVDQWTGFLVTFKKKESFAKDNLGKGRFYKYFIIISKQKRRFLISIILSLCIALASITVSLIYQQIIDKHVLHNGNGDITVNNIPGFSNLLAEIDLLFDNLHMIFLAVISLFIAQFILYLLRGLIVSKISKKSNEILMLSYYDHFLRLPLSFVIEKQVK